MERWMIKQGSGGIRLFFSMCIPGVTCCWKQYAGKWMVCKFHMDGIQSWMIKPESKGKLSCTVITFNSFSTWRRVSFRSMLLRNSEYIDIHIFSNECIVTCQHRRSSNWCYMVCTFRSHTVDIKLQMNDGSLKVLLTGEINWSTNI